MKLIAIFLTALLISSCGTAPAANSNLPSTANAQSPAAVTEKNTTEEPVIRFLLTSAAADFQQHGPKGPLQFRNVRVGHIAAKDGSKQHMLCGEFLQTQAGEKAEWTKFATIKTSGYEQYIGDNIYCQKTDVVWTEGDLSSTLQRKLEAMK